MDVSALKKLVEVVGSGDTLVVPKLDCLGWSTREVLRLVYELDQRGACEGP
jgi:DNA invertase Pin-like site-specific DNA recombinase